MCVWARSGQHYQLGCVAKARGQNRDEFVLASPGCRLPTTHTIIGRRRSHACYATLGRGSLALKQAAVRFTHFWRSLTSEAMVSCAQALRKPLPPGVEPAQVLSEFINAVNMEPEEIHVFLQTEESRRGAEEGTDEEKDGRRLGRRVIELLHKVHEHRSDPHAYPLSLIYEADLQQMYQ